MFVLDTHAWIWWVDGSGRLSATQRDAIEAADVRIVSSISCWEIAKVVELGRLVLDRPVLSWLHAASAAPGVQVLALTPEVAVASTELPGSFHRDPADQIIVATARVLGCRLVTSDHKILDYAHVESVA